MTDIYSIFPHLKPRYNLNIGDRVVNDNVQMPDHNVPQLDGLVGEIIGRSPRKGETITNYEVKFVIEGKENILFFRPHELVTADNFEKP